MRYIPSFFRSSRRSGYPMTILVGLMVASAWVPCLQADSIAVTGPQNWTIPDDPLSGTRGTYTLTYTPDPGTNPPANSWLGTSATVITDDGGDARLKLLAFNPISGTSLGGGVFPLSRTFDAAYSVSGPNNGPTLITHDYTVTWNFTGNPAGSGPQSSAATTGPFTIHVKVTGYVPEPSSIFLVATGGVACFVMGLARHRRRHSVSGTGE